MLVDSSAGGVSLSFIAPFIKRKFQEMHIQSCCTADDNNKLHIKLITFFEMPKAPA